MVTKLLYKIETKKFIFEEKKIRLKILFYKNMNENYYFFKFINEVNKKEYIQIEKEMIQKNDFFNYMESNVNLCCFLKKTILQ